MVTYAELIQIGILIVGICSLVYQICKKEMTALPAKVCGQILFEPDLG